MIDIQLLGLLNATLQAATLLFVAALGELITEKSGILNLGVEGMISIGAVAGFMTAVNTNNIFCTKIASKLARTYTNKHGLKDLIHELIGIELDKSSQSSDWGSSEDLSNKQIDYAANDVRYLIQAMHKLRLILEREGRYELAQECFNTIPVHSELDILKFSNIFEH